MLPGCAQLLRIDDTSGPATLDAGRDAAAITPDSAPCAPGSASFAFTGAAQTFARPACVTQITVDVRGGAGGAAFYMAPLGVAGLGGRVQATLTIAATDVVTVMVGGGGGDATNGVAGAGGVNGGAPGGVNNAAPAPQAGGGGGGASDMRINGATLADRVIVAAGGGGAASCFGGPHAGGNGGGTTGSVGDPCPMTTAQPGPGTQTGGGAGGVYPNYPSGSPGALGSGGTGAATTGGGGGGGGYYGGGGGSWNGGAGASSFAAATAANVVDTSGVQSGSGSVTISY